MLKWSASLRADTIDRNRAVAQAEGAVWWGRQSKPGTTGLGQVGLTNFRSSLQLGVKTYVFLHGAASKWRTRLVATTTDEADIEPELVPNYYDANTFHSLWVKIADFDLVDPSEITEGMCSPILATSDDRRTRQPNPLTAISRSCCRRERSMSSAPPRGRYPSASSEDGKYRSLTRIAQAGDILCSVRAPVGRLNLADRELIVGRGLAAIRRIDGHQALMLEQLRAALGSEDAIGGGTIFKAVSKSELSGLQVLEPTKVVADDFARVVGAMLDERIALTMQNTRLAATRDLLLPRLVSGRLDISGIDLGDLLSSKAA